MDHFAPITEAELAQARLDPVFRQKLVASHLEHLIAALNHLRATNAGETAARSGQIREGVTLAMRLSEILHRLGASPPTAWL